jgi:hypothetical protein
MPENPTLRARFDALPVGTRRRGRATSPALRITVSRNQDRDSESRDLGSVKVQ